MDLPCQPIPPTSEQSATILAFNIGRVFNRLPWDLRERLSEDEGALFLLSEAVFLRVTGVPDPVSEDVGEVEGGDKPCW